MTSATLPRPAPAPAPYATRLPGRWGRSVVLVMAIAAFMVWRTLGNTVENRAEVIPSVLVEIAVWSIGLMSLGLRSPSGEVRISDPAFWVMGWMGYYFLNPAFTWLSGKTIQLEFSAGMPLNTGIVTQIQYLHCLFITGFLAVYHLVAPRFQFRPVSDSVLFDRLPKVTPLILLGFLPIIIEVSTRILTSGSIRPTEGYGDSWVQIQSDITASRAAGGGDYVYTQILSKVWFVPLMSLGVGSGILFARLWRQRRWFALAVFHLQFPVLIYLGSGARSTVAMPFLMALVVADYLIGTIPWKYLVMVTLVGLAFFNFYGTFRGYQTQDLGSAVSNTLDSRAEDQHDDIERSEDGPMLVKEAFCIGWAESHGIERGGMYFVENLLAVLPLQIMPSKVEWMNTSNMLSSEMLGRQSEYGGVAGAIIGDGYFIGREAGVVILALVIGGILGVLVRILVSGNPGPPFWRVAIMACFGAQTVMFIRNDLSAIFMQVLYNVVIPALVFKVMTSDKRVSRWTHRLHLA